MKYLEENKEKRMLEELKNAKEIRKGLLEIVADAEKIGYATQFALETNEETARSAFQAGYQLGVQDGYIECLQKILMMFEEG